jgi:5-methylcytosine-specific restriction endonuclease McrA
MNKTKNTKGKYVRKNKRLKVFERDGFKCVYPNCEVKKPVLTIDHIIPISKGGPHMYYNVQATHRKCNAAKGNSSAGEQLRMNI